MLPPVGPIGSGRMTWAGISLRRAFQKLERAARVRRVDAAREEPAGLHHLMPGVMHRRGRVIDAAHERELVRDLRVQRKDFADLKVGIVRADRLERPANLARRVRLHVEGVELGRRAEIEDEDARLVAPRPSASRPCACAAASLRHRKAERAERADLEEIATRDAVAGGDGAGAGDLEHGIKRFRRLPRRMRSRCWSSIARGENVRDHDGPR